ncbi:hypothetical protein [Halpernia sp. GG3]
MRHLFSIFLLFALFSCRTESNSVANDPNKIPSLVSGKVYDFQRNIPVPNYRVKLQRQYRGICNFLSCYKIEDIQSTVSAQDGSYHFDFDYIIDSTKNEYGYFVTAENANGYIIENNIKTVEQGKNNTRDINAWKPISVNFNLNITNCSNPPLLVATMLSEDSGTFNNVAVDKNGMISLSLLAKPSAKMFLKFSYFVNGNYSLERKLIQPITTTNNENQSFDFAVDCSKF